MNIVIPEILSGGKGREMQRSAREIGDAVARGAQAVQKMYDQAGYIEAKKLDNDMDTELNSLYATEKQKSDGTNPNAAAEVRVKADQIYNKYSGMTTNSTAKDKLQYAYEARVANYTQDFESHNINQLWQTTMDGVKIKVAESVRMAGQNGDLTGGEEAIRKDLEAQREFFGNRYDAVSRAAMSLYYSNAIAASLYNPQTRGATIVQLGDAQYRDRYYKHLDADQVLKVERIYSAAKEQEGERQAFWDIGNRFGNNYAAAHKYALTPAAGKKYNLTVNQQQNIASSFAGLANAQNETVKAHDEETEKTLIPTALNGNISMAGIENSSLSREKKDAYASILKTPASADGFKTNPVVEAKLGDKIFSGPDAISDLEIALHVGRGLSRTDAEKLIKQRDYFLQGKYPEHQKVQAEEIFKSLEKDRKAGVFGDGRKGEIEYARKRSQFQRWLIQNPDKEPALWYEGIMGPEQKGVIGTFLDWAQKRNAAVMNPRDTIRADGTKKGTGYFGIMKTPEGKDMSELTIGVELDGKETQIPLLVPTLSKGEVEYLRKGGEPTEAIIDKAVAHAKKRRSEGRSVFYEKKYKAKLADGTMIYSDDGNNWYDDKGTKVE